MIRVEHPGGSTFVVATIIYQEKMSHAQQMVVLQPFCKAPRSVSHTCQNT